MKLNKAEIGDTFFGIVYKYSFRFMKGIKLVEFKITKVNTKTVGISFDNETRKYPQLMKKEEDNPCINTNKIKLMEDYMLFLKTSTFSDYLKKRINNYCKRKLKDNQG